MTADFAGKVALITGGSRGIGRACASQFAQHGARVAINYRVNRTAAEKTLRSLPDGHHDIFQGDVSDYDSVVKMVDSVIRTMGNVDILVNNAGIYELHDITKLQPGEWKTAWDRSINIHEARSGENRMLPRMARVRRD